MNKDDGNNIKQHDHCISNMVFDVDFQHACVYVMCLKNKTGKNERISHVRKEDREVSLKRLPEDHHPQAVNPSKTNTLATLKIPRCISGHSQAKRQMSAIS